MRKICAKIHLWLSIPFGIIIATTCFTGALLVFEDELLRLFHHSRYYVAEVGETPLSEDFLLSAAAEKLPGYEIKGIRSFDDPQRTYRIQLPGKRAAAFINPYTAEITGVDNGNGFFQKTMRLHRWLLDTYKRDSFSLGKLIVGISTIAFIFVLISGLISWMPRNKTALYNRLTIKTHKGWHRFLYDLHISGGFYMTSLLLIMALTGLTWSFGWYRDFIYSLFGDDMSRQEIRRLIYSLHVGTWGGLATRILYCLAAFLGSIFALTGYYFWIKKLLRK